MDNKDAYIENLEKDIKELNRITDDLTEQLESEKDVTDQLEVFLHESTKALNTIAGLPGAGADVAKRALINIECVKDIIGVNIIVDEAAAHGGK